MRKLSDSFSLSHTFSRFRFDTLDDGEYVRVDIEAAEGIVGIFEVTGGETKEEVGFGDRDLEELRIDRGTKFALPLDPSTRTFQSIL